MDLLAPSHSTLALLAAFIAGIVVGRLVLSRSPKPPRATAVRAPVAAGGSIDDQLAQLSLAERSSIDALIAEGRKIEAIKELRQALGCGLKEAKDMVDHIDAGTPRKAH